MLFQCRKNTDTLKRVVSKRITQRLLGIDQSFAVRTLRQIVLQAVMGNGPACLAELPNKLISSGLDMADLCQLSTIMRDVSVSLIVWLFVRFLN